MLFNSMPFMAFLLIVVLLYNAVPKRVRGEFVLLVGYVFYAFNGLIYVSYLLLITLLSYIGARIIVRIHNKRNTVLALFIVSVLSFLLFFKYTDFAIITYNDIASLWSGQPIELLHILTPIGISFYTFVAIGYLIDVYRCKTLPEHNIVTYALFLSYFPAILSGPIERSTTLLPQLRSLERTKYENAREGFVLLLWGLLYKMVLADRLSLCANTVFSDVYSYQGISLLSASLAFTFQIYFDFAGYTYMALGISRFFNIKLNNNFNKPYLAVSLTDFWRRWHISLTSWFRDYLYIPLGGNRVNQGRWIFNILVVFLVSGLWHGAYYTFIVWGAIHAVAQIIEKYVIRNKEARIGVNRGENSIIKASRIILTFCVVSAAWVFFKASSVEEALYLIKGASIVTDYNFTNLLQEGGTKVFLGLDVVDFLVIILFVPLIIIAELRVGHNNDGTAIPMRILKSSVVIRWGWYFVLSVIILWLGKFGVSEFVYFNF